MTEDEWLNCNDAVLHLNSLLDKVSARKVRLIACACCHGVLQWMTDARSKAGVFAAEEFADGVIGEKELLRFSEGTAGAWTTVWADGRHIYQSARAAHRACSLDHADAQYVPDEIRNAVRNSLPSNISTTERDGVLNCEILRQVALLRDIFGNPFRPVAVDPDWLLYRNGTVPKLAQTIYDDRCFNLLPILADALQEAGCTNADILQHCHSSGPHVRGCWVVDLLLGKA